MRYPLSNANESLRPLDTKLDSKGNTEGTEDVKRGRPNVLRMMRKAPISKLSDSRWARLPGQISIGSFGLMSSIML
jgi:hypothetical protein